MVVGVCRLRLSLPGNDSLKGKRSVVRQIVDKVRARFNVAVAEVADLDALGTATIGFAVVSNEGAHADSMLETVSQFVSAHARAIVTDVTTELVHIGSMHAGGRRGA
jgi:uncharacterized protein YlxP (DUF503 family)